MQNAQNNSQQGSARYEQMALPKNRIEAVIRRSGMSTNAFARYIGLPRGENLYQIKKGNNGVSFDVANRICSAFPEIDKLWLLTGDGQMISSDAPVGPWSKIGTPNCEAFRGWAAAQAMAGILASGDRINPARAAVSYANDLIRELAKKGGTL